MNNNLFKKPPVIYFFFLLQGLRRQSRMLSSLDLLLITSTTPHSTRLSGVKLGQVYQLTYISAKSSVCLIFLLKIFTQKYQILCIIYLFLIYSSSKASVLFGHICAVMSYFLKMRPYNKLGVCDFVF